MGYADIPGKTYGAHDGEMARLFKTAGWENIDAVHYGKDDDGLDCKFFGATSGNYLLWDESANTLDMVFTAGNTADNAVSITPTWSETRASGYARALLIEGTISGTLTGSAECTGIGIEIPTISANCPVIYPLTIYTGTIADKTIGILSAISVYMEDMGNAVGNFVALDIGINTTDVTGNRNQFIRLRQHSTVQTGSVGIAFEGTNACNFAFSFNADANCLASSTSSGNHTQSILVQTIWGTRYIYCYDS